MSLAKPSLIPTLFQSAEIDGSSTSVEVSNLSKLPTVESGIEELVTNVPSPTSVVGSAASWISSIASSETETTAQESRNATCAVIAETRRTKLKVRGSTGF